MNIFKKHVLSLLVVFSFVSYVLYRNDTKQVVALLPETVGNKVVIPKSTTPVPVFTPGPKKSMPVTPMPRMMAKKYKDGTYDGDVTDAYYGDMQVQVVVSGGNITAVNALKFPNDRDTSRRINNRAIKILKQETLVAQSAKIDAVSGASYSSPAFIESLITAINQAKI